MIKTYEASGKTVEDAINAALILADTTLDNVDVDVLDLGGRGVFGLGKKDARVRISLEVPDPPQPEPVPEKRERKNRDQQPEKAAKEKPKRPKVEAAIKPKEQPKEDQVSSIAAPENRLNSESYKKSPDGIKQLSRSSRNRVSRPIGGDAEKPRGNRQAGGYGYKVSAGSEAEALAAEAEAFLAPVFAKLQVNISMQTQVKEGVLWLTMSGSNLGSLIGRRGETLNALQYLTNLALNKTRKDHLRLVLDVEGYRAGREETLVMLAKKMADKAARTGRRVELDPMNPHERRIVHVALQGDRRVDTTSYGDEPYRRVVINRRRSAKPRTNKEQVQAPKESILPQGNQGNKASLSQQLAQQFDEQIGKRR